MLFAALLFYSCENDPEEIKQITQERNLPDQIAENIEMLYSEKGNVMVKITAPLMLHYENKRNPYTEMPKGVEVIFYDSAMTVESQLTARYAICRVKEKIWEVRNDVEVHNARGETFNSERLVWEELNEKVYSDVMVKITTEDEILFGEGFESDQYFDKWVLKKPTGQISIKQEDE